jgi:hypothetical protein
MSTWVEYRNCQDGALFSGFSGCRCVVLGFSSGFIFLSGFLLFISLVFLGERVYRTTGPNPNRVDLFVPLALLFLDFPLSLGAAPVLGTLSAGMPRCGRLGRQDAAASSPGESSPVDTVVSKATASPCATRVTATSSPALTVLAMLTRWRFHVAADSRLVLQ